MTTIALVGPMTGLPDYNYPAFKEARQMWQAVGHKVLDPSQSFGGNVNRPRKAYLRKSIGQIAKDRPALAFLPGWETSRGAVTEALVGAALELDGFKANPAVVDLMDAELDPFYEAMQVLQSHWCEENIATVLRDWNWPNIKGVMAGDHVVPPGKITYECGEDSFDRQVRIIRDLHASKRNDYTGGGDLLANYRFAGDMVGLDVTQSMFGRMSEKVYRLKNLLFGTERKVKDETIGDTYRDIAIIALLSAASVEE